MVMEMLAQLLEQKVRDGSLSLHYRCNNPVVTHLCFADDLIAFMQVDLNLLEKF